MLSINPVMELFLRLLKLSLKEAGVLDRVYSAETWSAVYDFSLKQSLMGVMFEGVQRLDTEHRPPKTIMMKWFTTAEWIKKRNIIINQRASELTEKLTASGLKSCILKGQGMGMLYPNPMARTPGDIDVWIDGGIDSVLKYVRSFFPNEDVVYHHTEFPIFKDVEVEVHFTPSWMFSYRHNRRMQSIFSEMAAEQFANRVVLPYTDNMVCVCVPTTEFNLLFILEHIYRHLFSEGIGMRQLVDYYYVLMQKSSSETKNRVIERLTSLNMLKFASAVMYIMSEVLGMDDALLIVPPDVKGGNFLFNEMMRAGNFGQYDPQGVYTVNKTKKQWLMMKRNMRFVRHYPSEVIWILPFRFWQYCWRKRNGYFKKK